MTNEIIGTAVLLSLAAIFSLINLKGYWIAVLLRVYSFLLCILAAFYYLTTLPGKKIRFQPLILAYNTIIPNLETSLISLSLFSSRFYDLQSVKRFFCALNCAQNF